MLEQYEGGLTKAILKEVHKAGRKGVTADEVAKRLFPNLPVEELTLIGDIINDEILPELRRGGLAVFSLKEPSMRSQQELEHLLDQYDLQHAEQGGLAGAVLKLAEEAGSNVMSAPMVADRFFPDLPDEDRRNLIDILNRDAVGDGRGWLRILIVDGDIPQRLRLAKKSKWQMQGRKVFDVPEGPRLALFELCEGLYWDGEIATRISDGAPDGFYVGLLGDDECLIRGSDGGNILYGPFASAEEAERMIWVKWQGTASVERDDGLIQLH
jgi:hypothetical protein